MARKKAEALPPLSTTLLPAEAGDVLKLDELYSFVGSKRYPRWVWIALCRQTRQVVAYFVGDRSADAARALRERILPAYRCRATRSDSWLAYAEVFPPCTHRCTSKGADQTCYIERCNNTLHQRLGRFVRRTLAFSNSSLRVIAAMPVGKERLRVKQNGKTNDLTRNVVSTTLVH